MAQNTPKPDPETAAKKAAADVDEAASRSEFEMARADLARQIEQLKLDMQGLTRTLSELGVAGRDSALAAARSRGEDLRGQAEARYTQARGEIDQVSHDIGDFVGRQPITAIGIAAAAGYLMGLMSGRK